MLVADRIQDHLIILCSKYSTINIQVPRQNGQKPLKRALHVLIFEYILTMRFSTLVLLTCMPIGTFQSLHLVSMRNSRRIGMCMCVCAWNVCVQILRMHSADNFIVSDVVVLALLCYTFIIQTMGYIFCIRFMFHRTI